MDMLWPTDFSVGPLFLTFFLGIVTTILLYRYSSQKHRFWKEKGVPYVKPLPFLGSVVDNMIKPFQFTDMDRLKKYGRIYGYYEGNRAFLSVAEPEVLRSILLKDFPTFTGRREFEIGDKVMEKTVFALRGEDWKRVRTILSPTFTTGKLKRMMDIFNECSKTLVQNFRNASERGDPIDAKSLFSAFTMDTIASTAFSIKLDSHNDPNNKFVEAGKHFFARKLNFRLIALTLISAVFPAILKLFKFNSFLPKAAEFFSQTVLQIIEERKRTGEKRNDFLQLLIDTAKETVEDGKLDLIEKDDIAENYGKVDSNQIFKGYTLKRNLSENELVAQCMIFFLAGFETTATTLSFVSYALALNPDIQERVIQDVDEALAANNGEVTYETLKSMKYLDNVIAETLRFYPPLARLERLANEDYKIGDTGPALSKGMVITVPIYVLHRDPEFFPNPEKFDPDRFSPEERSKQVPYSYLPFGAGPRNCIAMRFALMEVKVCMAHVLSNFRIKKCATTKVPLDYDPGLGFLQPKCISLFMEIRKDSAEAFLT